MRKLFALVSIVVSVFAVTAAPASAITGNFVEDYEHPFVGLVVFYDEAGNPLWRCSGSLLTPFVFLTAGHCTDDAASARIWFQQDAGEEFGPGVPYDPETGYPFFCPADIREDVDPSEDLCATSDELYNFGFDDFAGFPNTRDAGLIILDEPVYLSEYGILAEAGTLNALATKRGQQDVTFTPSGYGVSKINPVHLESYRVRLMAETKLVNLTSALNGGFNLQLSSAPAQGRGGTCFGDSGGPVFLGGFESNLIVGVNSFVLNQNCRGVGFAFRTDTEAVINWILGIVTESLGADHADMIQFG